MTSPFDAGRAAGLREGAVIAKDTLNGQDYLSIQIGAEIASVLRAAADRIETQGSVTPSGDGPDSQNSVAALGSGPVDLPWVEKFTGDYTWGGWLISTFQTPGGHTRHVVAHPVDRGHVLHIYGPSNIRPAERRAARAVIDDAAVDRALRAWFEGDDISTFEIDGYRRDMRAALLAAMGEPHEA